MKELAFLFTATAATVLASNLSAQLLPDHRRSTVPTAFAGSLNELIIGDFTGDKGIDACALVGREVVLLDYPETTAIYYSIGSPNDVEAIATARTSDPRTPDQLIATNGTHLHVAAFEDEVQWQSHPMPGWSSVDRLAVEPTSSGFLLVGIESSTTTNVVRIMRWDGTNTFVQVASPSAGAVVQDVAILNWSGDTTPEIAVVTNVGLEVFDATGTALATIPGTAGSGGTRIAPIHLGGIGPTDAIAWVRDNSSGYELRLEAASGAAQAPITLPIASLASVAAGEIHAGIDALLVAERTVGRAWTIARDSASSPFSLTNSFYVDFGVNGSGSSVPAHLVDMNNDGSADIVLGWDGDRTVHLALSLPTALRAAGYTDVLPGPVTFGVGYERILDSAEIVGDDLRMSLELPVGTDALYSHLQVTVWRQLVPHLAGNPRTPDPAAIQPIDPVWAFNAFIPISSDTLTAIAKRDAGASDDHQQHAFLRVRAINLDSASGAVVGTSPAYLFGLTSTDAAGPVWPGATPTELAQYYLRSISDQNPSTETPALSFGGSKRVGVLKRRGLRPLTPSNPAPSWRRAKC